MATVGSSFWMDRAVFETKSYDSKLEQDSDNLIKMASVKRAIANFVRIVTGENIKVKYSTGDNSLTNGKQVVISGNCVKDKNFDAAVGLALHEGSHIKLTNFDVIRDLQNLVPTHYTDEINDKYNVDPSKHFVQRRELTIIRLKHILNWIEDRRIDFYIYSTAPGYQCYYKAMYKRYFEDPIIDKGLLSGSMRDEDWKSYKFRIYNMTNPKSDLKALKNLQRIYDLIDLGNISRLKNTYDSFWLALEVYKLIEDAIPAPGVKVKEEPKKPKEQDTEKEKVKPTIYGYTAKGLPAGITINKRTGILSGQTNVNGTHKIIITSHMANGDKKRKRFALEV